jgi:hypothetical protein
MNQISNIPTTADPAPGNTRLKIKVSYALFHHQDGLVLGTMTATCSRRQGSTRQVVHLGGLSVGGRTLSEQAAADKLPQPGDHVLRQLKSVVRGHVQEYLKDTKYQILYNEDTGIRSEIREA